MRLVVNVCCYCTCYDANLSDCAGALCGWAGPSPWPYAPPLPGTLSWHPLSSLESTTLRRLWRKWCNTPRREGLGSSLRWTYRMSAHTAQSHMGWSEGMLVYIHTYVRTWCACTYVWVCDACCPCCRGHARGMKALRNKGLQFCDDTCRQLYNDPRVGPSACMRERHMYIVYCPPAHFLFPSFVTHRAPCDGAHVGWVWLLFWIICGSIYW